MFFREINLASLFRLIRSRLFCVRSLCLLTLGFLATVTVQAQFKFRETPNRQTPDALSPVDENLLWQYFLDARVVGEFSMEGTLVHRPARAASRSFLFLMEGQWLPQSQYTRLTLGRSGQDDVVREVIVVDDVAHSVDRDPDGQPVPAAPIDVTARLVEDLPFTWEDLLMPFLQWKGIQYAGPERYLGRPAQRYVLRETPGQVNSPSVTVTLDETYAALLKAEFRDSAGNPERRLRVGGFRQFDGVWMFSELFWEDRLRRDSVRLKVEAFRLP